MVLNVYYDPLSQPCRAILMFLDRTGIPYQKKLISLMKEEHMTKEYLAINSNHAVPCIEDTEKKFVLTESVAIIKYLCDAYKVDEHWYPRSDLIKRARVDEYLSWQHLGARMKCSYVFLNATVMKGQFENRGDINADMHGALSAMESYFLNGRNFLAGDEISIGDLFGICEIMQPIYGAKMDTLKDHEVLTKWSERVQKSMKKEFDEWHGPINGLLETLKKSESAKK